MAHPWMERTQELRTRIGTPVGGVPPLLAADGARALIGGRPEPRELALAEALAQGFTLAPLLDHTLLKAGATGAEVDRLCTEAVKYGFASVCINPIWVPRAAATLAGTPVRVCTVLGFPLGATTTEAKAFEAAQAVRDGAAEVDMVLDLGAALNGDWARVQADLQGVRAAVPHPTVLKVILETFLLDAEAKRRACALAAEARLDFVKTSTGFAGGGATVEDVALMRQVVGESVGVKASGGIRTFDQALAMIQAGATRLGVSASLAIVGASQPAGSGY